MVTLTISVPESLKEFVDAQVRMKGYGDASEYFRVLLQDVQIQEAEARLEALLIEGLDSGEDIEVTPTFWSELKAEAARRTRDRQRQ
jgi:antitoxin ParD1/3/4